MTKLCTLTQALEFCLEGYTPADYGIDSERAPVDFSTKEAQGAKEAIREYLFKFKDRAQGIRGKIKIRKAINSEDGFMEITCLDGKIAKTFYDDYYEPDCPDEGIYLKYPLEHIHAFPINPPSKTEMDKLSDLEIGQKARKYANACKNPEEISREPLDRQYCRNFDIDWDRSISTGIISIGTR